MTGIFEEFEHLVAEGFNKTYRRFDRLEHRLERLIIMATQEELDVVTRRLNELESTLRAENSEIAGELVKLQEAHPELDLTGLKTAVDAIATDVAATAALVPNVTSEPTPEPAPEPSPEPAQPVEESPAPTEEPPADTSVPPSE